MGRVFFRELALPYVVGIVAVGLVLLGAQVALADNASTQVVVSNSAPSVSSVQLNGASVITLTENVTTTVFVTATITDANGCADVISSGTVTFAVYRSSVSNGSACTANAQNCYRTTTYNVVASDLCSGGTDTTANVSTTVAIWYFADPTDASSTSYAADTWIAAVTAADFSSAQSSSTDSRELNTLLALDVTGSINYGSLTANTDTGATNQVATTTNTGNVRQRTDISGTDMTSGANSIAATQQKFATSSATYASLTHTLSTSPTNYQTNIQPATTSTVPAASTTYWGIAVPNGQMTGTYTGTNTFSATWY